jgi:hypothetical protein
MNPILCRSLRRRMALAAACTVPLAWLLTASAGQTTGAPADLVIVNGRFILPTARDTCSTPWRLPAAR